MSRILAIAAVVSALPTALASASHRDQEPLPNPATVRIVGATPDPAGGPPWAVRTWRTIRAPSHGLRGGQSCLQIGRAVPGGMVRTFASGVTRPMNFRDRTICGTISRSAAGHAPVIVERLVDDPASPAPQLAHTVVAGLAPRKTRKLDLVVGRERMPIRIDASTRAWLAVLPGSVRQAHLILRYGFGHYARRIVFATGETPPTDADRERLVPGSTRRALSAPDPAGGLPFGLVTYTMEGTEGRRSRERCTEPGRLVDGEIGPYETTWGSFLDSPVLASLHGFMDVWLPHAYAANTTTGCDDTYGARRAIEGLGVRRFGRHAVVLHGPVRADVRAVTMRTTSGFTARAALGGGAFLGPVRTTNVLNEAVILTAELASGRRTTRKVMLGDSDPPTSWAQYAALPDGSGVRLAWIAGNSDHPFVGVDVVRHPDRLVVAVRELHPPDYDPVGTFPIDFLIPDVRCADIVLDVEMPLGDAAAGGRLRPRVPLEKLQVPQYGAAPTTCVPLRPGDRLPAASWLEEDLKGFPP